MKKNLYSFLAEFAIRYKKQILITTLLLSLLPLSLLPSLELRTDYAELIRQEAPYQKKFNQYLKSFGASEALFVIIRSPYAREIAQTANDLLLQLKDKNNRPLVRRVLFKINKKFMYKYGILFANQKEFQESIENATFLAYLQTATNLAEFLSSITLAMDEASRHLNLNSSPSDLIFIEQLLQGIQNALVKKKVDLPPILKRHQKSVFKEIDPDGYFVLPNHQLMILMQVFPETTSDDYQKLKIFLNGVKKCFQQAAQNYPNTKIFYTGSPQLTVDEMEDSSRDIQRLTLFSILGVGLIFTLFFGRFIWPILSILVLGIAILWTFGLAVILFGYLNIVSVVFAAVLIGLGIDFGIHIIERYSESICSSAEITPHKAAKEAVVKTGIAITTSALTTSAAFFISAFSGFKGSFQLGILGGLGILICLAFMVTLLPGILVWIDQKRPLPKVHPECKTSRIIHLVLRLLKYPKTVIALTMLAVFLSSFSVFSTQFDTNLLNLQRKNSQAKLLEETLIEDYGISARFAILLKSYPSLTQKEHNLKAKEALEQIRTLVEKLKSLPSVNPSKVEAITNLLPPEKVQEKRLQILLHSPKLQRFRQLYPTLQSQPPKPISPQPPSRKNLIQALEKLQEKIEDLQEKTFGKEENWTVFFEKIIQKIDNLLQLLSKTNYEKKHLLQYQHLILHNFRENAKILPALYKPQKLTLKDIPPELKTYFISPNGLCAIYVYPKENIRIQKNLENFIQELRSVDPHITGPSVQTYEVLKEMKEGYQKAGLIAVCVVFLILLLEFRNLWIASLAISPLIFGSLLMLGCMYLLNVHFNPANLMALPLLFGVGIDNSIHILHRFYREKEYNLPTILHFTGKAILITSLTTIVGFGSFLLASHQGLKSLGIIMSIGILCCLFTSLVLLPCMLKLLSKQGKTHDDP
ncbi:MAG: hypothetical protein D6805_02835 [Planctomycetota bacterium]|nr:MAG: hypothetical protein D6805_02835 [Planctomycetota bacterium]